MSQREFQSILLQKEFEKREAKRIRIGMNIAHFPRVCTLEGFDFSAFPAWDPGIIRDLETMDWGNEKNLSSSAHWV